MPEREKPYLTVLDDPDGEYAGGMADEHDLLAS